MKKHHPFDQLNNRGITLLEVIIAVSMFSIAAIVLLQGFVTSSRVNKKSNLYLEATSTAQNVMEEIKAKSFEEVALAFNYPIDQITGKSRFTFLEPQKASINTPDGVGICEKLRTQRDGAFVYTDVRLTGDKEQVTASIFSQDDGKTYEFHPRKSGENASRYYYQMTNVRNLHETFDVLAEFDGSHTSGYKKKNNLVTEDEKNDFLSPNIAKLDTKSNGFLIMPKAWDDKALINLAAKQLEIAQNIWHEDKTKWIKDPANLKPDDEGNLTIRPTGKDFVAAIGIPCPETPLDYREIYKQTRRTLQITLEQKGGFTTAKARYTLNARGYADPSRGKYGRMDICDLKGCNGTPNEAGACKEGCCMYTSTYVPFYSSDAGVELKNLYVFYYPNYESTNPVEPLDLIEFDNTINYLLSLYVVKQQDEENNMPTSSQERGYRMNLTIKEDPGSNGNANWNTNPALFRAQTRFRTNLDTDISAMEEGKLFLERPTIDQTTLVYQDSSGRWVKNSNARKVLDYNGLDDRKERDRIYTAKVSVYHQGAAAKNFPEEECIYTLDGSKED